MYRISKDERFFHKDDLCCDLGEIHVVKANLCYRVFAGLQGNVHHFQSFVIRDTPEHADVHCKTHSCNLCRSYTSHQNK